MSDKTTSVRWRWNRVVDVVSGKTAFYSLDDNDIRRGVGFTRRYRRGLRGKRAAELKYPDLYVAHEIFAGTDTKWHLEPALLSEAKDEQIAEYFEISKAAVEEYARFFFDVRGRKRGWLMCKVMSPALRFGDSGSGYDAFWKLVAMESGWDALVGLWDNGVVTAEQEEQLDRLLKIKVKVDALQAAHTRRITQYNANEVVSQGLSVSSEDKDKDSSSSTATAVSASLAMIMNSIRARPAALRENIGRDEPRAIDLM
jgi:hypothetical protein